jgi:hypothetical protein
VHHVTYAAIPGANHVPTSQGQRVWEVVAQKSLNTIKVGVGGYTDAGVRL